MRERLDRIERLLEELIERLDRLEKSFSNLDARLAMEVAKLSLALALPPTRAAIAAATVASILGEKGLKDEISLAVIEALSQCEPLSLTELEHRVRKLRGRASKHSIRKRLEALASEGVVKEVWRGSRRLFTLAKCLER